MAVLAVVWHSSSCAVQTMEHGRITRIPRIPKRPRRRVASKFAEVVKLSYCIHYDNFPMIKLKILERNPSVWTIHTYVSVEQC
jgi:hypothetical protein